MFKINSDPKDKFQPILLRDWSKGLMLDIDPYDAPQDSLFLCSNLRYLPGKMVNLKTDKTETMATVTASYSISNSFFHQSSIDEAGDIGQTDFHYFTSWYSSPPVSNVYRAWYSGSWNDEVVAAFSTVNGDPKLFQSYGDMIDIAQSFHGSSMNIQWINRDRFLSDITIDELYASEEGTAAPEVLNVTDTGWDLYADINSTVTTVVLTGTPSFVAGDYMKIDDEIMRVTNVAASNLTVDRGEKTTGQLSHTAGADIYAEADADYLFTEPLLNVACNIIPSVYLPDNLYKGGDELEYAISFIRDGSQESSLVECGVTATVIPGTTLGQLQLSIQDDNSLDYRVTAIRVYHRLNAGEWYFLNDIDMDTGQDSTLADTIGSENWRMFWEEEYNCYNITVYDDGDNSGYTFTYFQKSGFPLDNESTNLMYKVATTNGNRRIVANVKKNGIEYPGRIYISVPDQVNTFPDNNYLDLIEDDQTAFTALIVWNRILFAFKQNEVHIIDIRPPNESSWRVIDKRNYGVTDHDKVVAGIKALYFATDSGIVQYTNDFKRITDDSISTEASSWSGNLGFDFIYDELLVDLGSVYIYDKYGRWWTESFITSPGHRFLNNEDKETVFMDRDGSNVDLITRQGSTGEKLIDMRTHPQRPGPDNDFILRRVRLRFKNSETGTFYIKYSIDNSAWTALTNGTGTSRGTGADSILEWTGKMRFKTIAFQVYNSSGVQVEIKELIYWATPRKGRRNA